MILLCLSPWNQHPLSPFLTLRSQPGYALTLAIRDCNIKSHRKLELLVQVGSQFLSDVESCYTIMKLELLAVLGHTQMQSQFNRAASLTIATLWFLFLTAST